MRLVRTLPQPSLPSPCLPPLCQEPNPGPHKQGKCLSTVNCFSVFGHKTATTTSIPHLTTINLFLASLLGVGGRSWKYFWLCTRDIPNSAQDQSKDRTSPPLWPLSRQILNNVIFPTFANGHFVRKCHFSPFFSERQLERAAPIPNRYSLSCRSGLFQWACSCGSQGVRMKPRTIHEKSMRWQVGHLLRSVSWI